MTTHKLTLILSLIITGTFMIIAGCCSKKTDKTAKIEPSGDEKPLIRAVEARKWATSPYGKLKVPAEIYVDLTKPEHTGDPVRLTISAITDIAASSGIITLKLPEIDTEPARTEVLWSGNLSDLIVQSKEYVLPALPVGKYHFVGILEFTPDQENADKLVVSDSLYLDVRADKILSSNVSFRQIERVELYKELEQRVLKSLNPGLATADPQTMARYRDLIESTKPGLIKTKIAELRANDPDVARRIMAMNSTNDQGIESDSNPVGSDDKDPPAFERAVPVPDGIEQ